MIMFDHKKAIGTIIGNRKLPDGSHSKVEMKPEVAHKENGTTDGRHVAMQDFLSGVQEKSPMKMMHAMAAFHDLHQAQRDMTPEESEESAHAE